MKCCNLFLNQFYHKILFFCHLVGEMWGTWHAHNFILFGLTKELAYLGVSEREFKVTTFKLWAKFLKLNKIAFFEKKFFARPRLPFGFKNRYVLN